MHAYATDSRWGQRPQAGCALGHHRKQSHLRANKGEHKTTCTQRGRPLGRANRSGARGLQAPTSQAQAAPGAGSPRYWSLLYEKIQVLYTV